jgi:hypothetical protein
MKVLYGIFGLVMLGLSGVFYYMTTLPWVTGQAYGYVLAVLLALSGFATLYSAIFIKNNKEDKS